MSDVQEKCSVCQALIDEEDLFCSNCGTEAYHPDAMRVTTKVTTHVFKCRGCGASMSYDAASQALRCPFCGSGELERNQDQLSVSPKFVVPATVGQAQAEAALRKWLGSSFWRPSDLAASAVVRNMSLVYVPFWVFRANTYTYWTADSSVTPRSASGDWVPVTGHHRSQYAGLLVGASSVLATGEIRGIEPYDFSQAVPVESFDLDAVTYEQFRVPRKYARPFARNGFEQWEAESCKQYVAGRCRNMKVNIRFESMASDPVLLPCWIMAYQYKGQVYRFLLNGQTGKPTGTAPTSYWKIALVLGGVAAAILGGLACAGMCAGLLAV
ncbi:MAG: hypothetical protein R3B96_05140 [Pirellulaceae bacterium]